MRLGKQIAAFATVCVFSGTAVAVGSIAAVTLYDRAEGHELPVYRHGGRYYLYRLRARHRCAGGGDRECHYGTYCKLVAQGVIRAPRVAMPTLFPGQFVPDPR